nr:metal iron transporter [Kwoniella dejecticola CBS 10117]OBR86567.1 metal iron transporter [Kwoniella dejecticola CBS 10117]
MHFVGPGLVSSVAYIDPGNWATDLEAGATYGYKLLFIVLLAGLAAVVLQLLSVRLGAITSHSLPQETRLLFLRLQAKYPKYRIPLKICLYTLYALAEIAIIGTDLAELLGSAIALHLLFPKLPLFAGVLITAVDVMIVLVFFRSNSGRQGMLFFEIVIVSLVLAVFVSFMILLKLTSPVWEDVFFGLVPSSTLVKPGALYIGVGIIGATVMPHALFLGSSLASVDRLNMLPIEPSPAKKPLSASLPSLNPFRRRKAFKRSDSDLPTSSSAPEAQSVHSYPPLAATSSRTSAIRQASTPTPSLGGNKDIPMEYEEGSKEEIEYMQRVKEYEMQVRKFDRIKWVDVHLLHATIDTALSLLGFALTINSSILTLAGAAFYYGPNDADADDADLFGAYALIRSYIGHAAAIIFALALLCAGQSASITATLAGQVVSEGFINWKTSPLVRRLITRLIGVIPAAIVASAVGPSGLNTMLVASQVLLSIVLPTVIFPLVYLCSREEIMTVQGPEIDHDHVHVQDHANTPPGGNSNGNSNGEIQLDDLSNDPTTSSSPRQESPSSSSSAANDLQIQAQSLSQPQSAQAEQIEQGQKSRRSKSYVSPKWVTVLGYALFGVVVLANAYVIVQLCLGNG